MDTIIAKIKAEANTLLELAQDLVAQTKVEPFDVGETSISVTAVGDSVEKLEELVDSDDDTDISTTE